MIRRYFATGIATYIPPPPVRLVDTAVADSAFVFTNVAGSYFAYLSAADRPDIAMLYGGCQYGGGAAGNYMELTFSVSGTPEEGVDIYGATEATAHAQLFTNAGISVADFGQKNYYNDMTKILYSIRGLTAGTHVIKIVRVGPNGGGNTAVVIGGAQVYTRLP